MFPSMFMHARMHDVVSHERPARVAMPSSTHLRGARREQAQSFTRLEISRSKSHTL